MHLALTDEQADLLVAELDRIVDDDHYPLSVRARSLPEMADAGQQPIGIR